MSKFRYGVIVLFICILLFEGTLFIPTARAQISDGSGWAIFGLDVGKKVTDAVNWAWSNVIKPVLRDAIVKRIVDNLTNDIVQSIENGGRPLFVSNLGDYTKRATDIAFDSFNNRLMSQAGLDLCAPFQSQLQIYFNVNMGGANRYPLGIPTRCGFDQFKQNIQNTGTFIQSGGWIGMQQLFLPSNNLLGASISLESAYYSRVAQEQEKRTTEYQAGKGFLGVKQCTFYENIDNPDGDPVNADTFDRMANQWCQDNNDGSQDCVDRLKENNCVTEETKTPGDIVAQSATKATIKDFEYADNVQSIISALVNVFIKNIFDKGKGLIFGSTAHGGSGLASNSYDFSSLSGNTLEDQKISAQKTIRKIDNDYYQIQLFLKDTVLPYARLGRKAAINAIYLCSLANRSFPPPVFGYLKYEPQSGMVAQAKLGDLVNYPFTFVSPDFPTSEPDLLSLVKHNLLLEKAGVNASPARIFPPAADSSIPQKEGFYEQVITEATQALGVLDKNRTQLKTLATQLDAVNTATSTTQVVGGRSELVILDTASSTARISDLLNKANTPYGDFISGYSKYTLEPLGGDAAGAGPGMVSASGIGNALTKMMTWFVPGDIIDLNTGNITGQTGNQYMFYCDPNR